MLGSYISSLVCTIFTQHHVQCDTRIYVLVLRTYYLNAFTIFNISLSIYCLHYTNRFGLNDRLRFLSFVA